VEKFIKSLRTGVCVLLLANGFCLAAYAAPQENVRDGKEPEPDAMGVIPQKIIHRIAPPQPVSTVSPFGPGKPIRETYAIPVGSTGSNAYPIQYHGGPVMAGLSKVVLIWYGNWNRGNGTDTPQGQQIIRNAIYGLANDATTSGYSDYSGITTSVNTSLGSYAQTSTGPVSMISAGSVECSQAASSTYGGTRLSDAYVQKLVKTMATSLCSGGTPIADAIYLVLSSSDISESSGFLTKYCGWHTYATMTVGGTSVPVKYGFIGNPSKSISTCAVQTTSSPNNNPGVDAMVSVIAHELEETVTDPMLNAWYNSQGAENGDMCAWTFGKYLFTASNNSSYYNVTLPVPTNLTVPGNYSGQYLIQRALAVSNSACYSNGNPLSLWQ